MTNPYKQAAQMKLRFSTPKGQLPVEYLWDLSDEELSEIYSQLMSEKEKSGHSLLKPSATGVLDLKIGIIEDVFGTRQQARKEAQDLAETAQLRRQLQQLLAEKRMNSLRDLSEEELLAKLKEL
jgi:hypothetical protein